MTPVRLTRQAEADIGEAFQWYEAKKPTLGVNFMERVDEAILKIAQNPMGFAKVIEDARRVGLRRFPYALWYKVEASDGSIVIACLHAKRAPAITKERALGIIRMPRKSSDTKLD